MPAESDQRCTRRDGGVSRRLLLRAAAAAGGATLLTPRSGTTPLGSGAAAAQDDDSTLVFLAFDTAYSLDPAQNWDYGGGATILAHVYEGLFKFTGSTEAVLEPSGQRRELSQRGHHAPDIAPVVTTRRG